jgi:predicted aconitase/predicted aconitase with swiveling domain
MTQASAPFSVLPGKAEGPVLATTEPLSFWGGVSPDDGRIIDVHHPLHGQCLTGTVLVMPSSRGSCSGSGVLLDLVLTGRAPAALVFQDGEDVLTLGALVAHEMFGRLLPVVRLPADVFAAVSGAAQVTITPDAIKADGVAIALAPPPMADLELTDADRGMLEGADGPAAQQAMRIICTVAVQQGATRLLDVTRAHIDGCIYASPANLIFAQKVAALGAQVRIPTTMNAISVDLANWASQGVPAEFGGPAAKLAEAYVAMGCQPTFTCSPYLLPAPPVAGEAIAWSESNAVIFANSVLGARTPKHPDFLDLCMAITGRAPASGVYLDDNRRPGRIIDVALPGRLDDPFWPLVGYVAGQVSPDRIPLLRGLADARPSPDDLKALCAAFGTTSAAPMLHIEGVTPEADMAPAEDADHAVISRDALQEAWAHLHAGPEQVDLVAIGSPHASLTECRAFADALAGRSRHTDVAVIITAGRDVIAAAAADGTLTRLRDAGVRVLQDLCWCTISEPVFPPSARTVMTNSGKYAHYGPGLSGRTVRFGSIADCAEAATTGRARERLHA